MTARDLVQVAFFALIIKPFMTLFIGLRVRGAEHLLAPYPLIIVANHSSHLDTASLLSQIPLRRLARVRPVAAADYFERNRLISVLSHALFNILPIARKRITAANHPVPRMVNELEAGRSLLVFPEGTRGTGEGLGHFHAGVARVLLEVPNVQVLPVCLVNMGRSLPKGEWIPVPFFCEVRVGAPRLFQGSPAEITQALEAAVRELMDAP